MAEPSVAGGETRTSGGRDTLRRAALLVIGFAVSYGLVLSVLSDTFFWFAIPGMLGLATVVILALQGRASSGGVSSGTVMCMVLLRGRRFDGSIASDAACSPGHGRLVLTA